MTGKELKQIIEEAKHPELKCKRCIWGKTIFADKDGSYTNVYCMFPTCIKTKHIKNEDKDD